MTSESGFPANMRRQTAPGVYGAAGRLPGDARCPAANRIAVAAGANNASAPFRPDAPLSLGGSARVEPYDPNGEKDWS